MENENDITTYLCTLTSDGIKRPCFFNINDGKLQIMSNRLVCSHKYTTYKDLNNLKWCECERISSSGVIRKSLLDKLSDSFKQTVLKRKGKIIYRQLKENKNENL